MFARYSKRTDFAKFAGEEVNAIMQRMKMRITTTVPVPLQDEIAIGTLMSIIRQSGIERTQFEN